MFPSCVYNGLNHGGARAYKVSGFLTGCTAERMAGESPASILLRTHSMSLELFDQFHAWSEPGPAAVEPEVGLFRPAPRQFFIQVRGREGSKSHMPAPTRFIRKSYRFDQTTTQVDDKDEHVLSGCGLSSSGSSTGTELLEPADTQFEFSDLDHLDSEPVSGRKRKETPCGCGAEGLEEGEVCLRGCCSVAASPL